MSPSEPGERAGALCPLGHLAWGKRPARAQTGREPGFLADSTRSSAPRREALGRPALWMRSLGTGLLQAPHGGGSGRRALWRN